jgi:SnoaL-like domain
MATETQTTSLGEAFADALSRKDFDEVARLLHPDVDFRGMTPSRIWEGSDAHSVVENVLKVWFEPSDELERLVSTQTDTFADRVRVGYRLEGHNPDGPFVVEQQAYYEERDGRIGWMRVLCSGFRPRAA